MLTSCRCSWRAARARTERRKKKDSERLRTCLLLASPWRLLASLCWMRQYAHDCCGTQRTRARTQHTGRACFLSARTQRDRQTSFLPAPAWLPLSPLCTTSCSCSTAQRAQHHASAALDAAWRLSHAFHSLLHAPRTHPQGPVILLLLGGAAMCRQTRVAGTPFWRAQQVLCAPSFSRTATPACAVLRARLQPTGYCRLPLC
jgi:hypothetical protein